MDWGRAKDILIVAFLALNLFLGFRLWTEMSRYPAATSQLLPEEIAATLITWRRPGLNSCRPHSRRPLPCPSCRCRFPLNPRR